MITLSAERIYYEKDNSILENINFSVESGEIVTLIGASGLGKSTILKIIAGLHDGYDGSLSIPPDMRIAFISQNKCLLPWKSVYENIILLKKAEKKEIDKKKAEKLIDDLGLSGYQSQYPSFLSGGQYQRAALGQAFFYEPDIILMDEPFSALDSKTKKEVQDLFLKLQKTYHITTLMVTHDVGEAVYMNSRIINLEENTHDN